MDIERQEKSFYTAELNPDKANIGSKSDSCHCSSFKDCISQATVSIALLSTLSMTLMDLVMAVVHQHHLWARFSAQPYRGTLFWNPYTNPERLTCYPWGNWSSGGPKCLPRTLSSSGSKADPKVWATSKTQLGFQKHGETCPGVKAEHGCKKGKQADTSDSMWSSLRDILSCIGHHEENCEASTVYLHPLCCLSLSDRRTPLRQLVT